jgi:hypothetical protein
MDQADVIQSNALGEALAPTLFVVDGDRRHFVFFYACTVTFISIHQQILRAKWNSEANGSQRRSKTTLEERPCAVRGKGRQVSLFFPKSNLFVSALVSESSYFGFEKNSCQSL